MRCLLQYHRRPARQPGLGQYAVHAFITLPGAVIGRELAADKNDIFIAAVNEMVRHRLTGLVVRQTDVHVDRMGAVLHDFHHRFAVAFEQRVRALEMLHARNDHPRRRPAQKRGYQRAFLVEVVVGVAQHQLVAGFLCNLLDARHYLDEHRIGQRRHDDRNNVGSGGSQSAGDVVGYIAELFHGAFDFFAQLVGNRIRLVQRPRHGDG